ncbi:hypothetical protein J6R97_05130 [bacterium]|nr:hypothetical protein [bacterium]
MSTNINSSLLKSWITEKVGKTLDLREAKNLHIEDAYQNSVEEMDEIDIDDIFKNFNSDLYEEFATLYVTEQDKKAAAKSEEEKKEEQSKIKDKNGAGV